MLKNVRRRSGDESGVSLVEMLIALVLFSVVVVSVDSSLTVVQERQVQTTNSTEALNNLQVAEEAITTDLRAATTWTDPALPTTTPSGPTAANPLLFDADLNGPTLVGIALNTTTHQLQVCTNANPATPVTITTVCSGSGITMQAQVNNVDSSSSFTLSANEVSTTINSTTTNAWYYTSAATNLIVDTPKVGATHVSQVSLQSPTIVSYGGLYSCQTALSAVGATGSC